MKYCVLTLILVSSLLSGSGQTSLQSSSSVTFVDYQKTFPRISDVLNRKEDTLIKQFQEKNLQWPARYIYLRSFKFDSQLEVWVKNEASEKFKLFKTYKVCALSGSLGPKRMQGDYQVPEGFYYINEFNPRSAYYLSLGLNYPNASDKLLADSLQPGGDIYIHGSCVTTGCIPVTNTQIEELYILATYAKNAGQDFIPVHIFPIHFKNPKSVDYLNKFLKDFPEYTSLNTELKRAYDYFDKTRELPVVMVNRKGGYVIEANLPPDPPKEEKVVRKKDPRPVKHINEEEIAKVVDKLPEFPGGNEKFQAFLDQLSREMVNFLNEDQPKTYVMVEFIIDKDGNPINAKVIKGGNEELNDQLADRFDKMPTWKPAIRTERNVAVRLKQSLYIERAKP